MSETESPPLTKSDRAPITVWCAGLLATVIPGLQILGACLVASALILMFADELKKIFGERQVAAAPAQTRKHE